MTEATVTNENYVATAVSISVESEYGDVTVTGPWLEFVAARTTEAEARSELAGWVSEHITPQNQRNYLLQITQLNNQGDMVNQLTYKTVTTITLKLEV